MNPFGVVSFDPDKVWIEDSRSGRVVAKKTTDEEVVRIAFSQKKLAQVQTPFKWDGRPFVVRTPAMISWDADSKILRESYCHGNNLEILLRICSAKQRPAWVNFLRDFLWWMKRAGFFWTGLAPRHLIIDQISHEVSLVDFERPVRVSPNGFSDKEFNECLRGTVHEELCAFLFREEQESLFPNIWRNIGNGNISWNNILSLRQRLLILFLFGSFGNPVTQIQLATVQHLLASAVTPFIVDGRPLFPLVHLDRIRGAKNYVKTILELARQERKDWPHILETISSVSADKRISSGR